MYVGFVRMRSGDADRTASVVLASLRETRTRAVLAKGWGALSATAFSEDIHVVDSGPHDWLFHKCSAIINHGGAGTTHKGLRWGRPTLVPLNKLSVARLEAALRELRAKPIQVMAVSMN